MTVGKTQVCSKCGRELLLTAEYYHRDKSKSSGFKPECKDCNKKRWEENKDRYNARAKEYYRENVEYFKNRPLPNRIQNQEKSRENKIERKRRAVNRLGGACECCGLTGPLGLLHFHHRDPKTKLGGWGWMLTQPESVRNAELDKCSLLCSNCHMGYHYGYVEYDEWSGYKWKEPLEYKYRTVA